MSESITEKPSTGMIEIPKSVIETNAERRAAVAKALPSLGVVEPQTVEGAGGRFGRGTVPVEVPGPQAIRQAGFGPGGARFGESIPAVEVPQGSE